MLWGSYEKLFMTLMIWMEERFNLRGPRLSDATTICPQGIDAIPQLRVSKNVW